MAAGRQVGRHDFGALAESLHLSHKHSGKRVRLGVAWSLALPQ